MELVPKVGLNIGGWIIIGLLLDYYNHINHINYIQPKSGLNTVGWIIRPAEQKEDIRVGPVPTEVKVEWDTERKNSEKGSNYS